MDTRVTAIYRDPKRLKDFRLGFRKAIFAAAEFLESWDGEHSKYRLGDILRMKFNQSNRKPRLSKCKPVAK